MAETYAPAERERGWRSFLAALAAFALVPATPFLLTLAPVAQTLVLLVPAVAACALVGWRGGGGFWLAAFWTTLAGWVLTQPMGIGGSRAFETIARGWALLLGATFGVVCLVTTTRTFLTRALAAISIALALGSATSLAVRGGPARVERLVRTELTRRNDETLAEASVQWRALNTRAPSTKPMTDAVMQEMASLPAVATAAFPALLALESLAALALAWGAYHRLSRTRIGAPLAPLRELRFSDQLVWGIVVGMVFVLLSTLGGLRGVGINLLVFFAMLYVLRGLGVLAWFATMDRVLTLSLIGSAVILPLVLGAVALALGLGDTWLDWRRSRVRPTA